MLNDGTDVGYGVGVELDRMRWYAAESKKETKLAREIRSYSASDANCLVSPADS